MVRKTGAYMLKINPYTRIVNRMEFWENKLHNCKTKKNVIHYAGHIHRLHRLALNIKNQELKK